MRGGRAGEVKPAFTEKDLIRAAERLLSMGPDPVPRFRTLKDLLQLPPEDAERRAAERALGETAIARLLSSTQLPDGTWGRFHTRNSRLKAPFPTTEMAITAALDSGFDAGGPLLRKTLKTVTLYATGKAHWPDPPEKHDNPLAWPIWERHFAAAVLAEMDPSHSLLPPFRTLWIESLRASFASGAYDRDAEIVALNRLLECRMKDPVPFHRKYPLLILSSAGEPLPASLERAALSHVLGSREGIYYACDGPLAPPRAMADKSIWSWIRAHKLLSRFPYWRTMARGAMNAVWNQCGEHGLWNSSASVAKKPYTAFPLSESWRRPENRVIDCSVVILDLLMRVIRKN